ncbi:MAG: hypothetical protein EA380_03410 [Phycisphaeraceae bacterium]|nr:MAG: hypothetical protein EA380_03410 [Phycisphaeraceae bacterium]
MASDSSKLQRFLRGLNPVVPRGYVTRHILPFFAIALGGMYISHISLPEAHRELGMRIALAIAFLWPPLAMAFFPKSSIFPPKPRPDDESEK